MEEKSLHAEGQGAARSSLSPAKQGSSNKPATASPVPYDATRHSAPRSLGKEERLSRDILLDKLFSEGKSVSQNGFTLVYLECALPTFYPAQAAFSVPKKHFKHATDRNRIKRLLRESYRHEKPELYVKLAAANKQLALMLICKGKEVPAHAIVQKNVSELIVKLLSRIIK